MLIQMLQQIAAPLSPYLLLCAIVAGLVFGVIHNSRRNIPGLVYYQFGAGLNFLIFILVFRLLSSIVGGTPILGIALGWIGITILWSIFCLFIRIGQLLEEKRVGK